MISGSIDMSLCGLPRVWVDGRLIPYVCRVLVRLLGAQCPLACGSVGGLSLFPFLRLICRIDGVIRAMIESCL